MWLVNALIGLVVFATLFSMLPYTTRWTRR
jgi:hypothetical protein